MKNQVVELKKQGFSIRVIAEKLGISKGSVQNYLKSDVEITSDSEKKSATADAVDSVIVAGGAPEFSLNPDIAQPYIKQPKVSVKPSEFVSGAVVKSFVGLERIDVNEYSTKDGEIFKVRFIRATTPDGFGHFVVI